MRHDLRPYIEKIGGIFQYTPAEIVAAWEAHRPFVGRMIKLADFEGYLTTLLRLKRIVRKVAGRTGYFIMDGHLVGYGGPGWDPKWLICPSSTSLELKDGRRRQDPPRTPRGAR